MPHIGAPIGNLDDEGPPPGEPLPLNADEEELSSEKIQDILEDLQRDPLDNLEVDEE